MVITGVVFLLIVALTHGLKVTSSRTLSELIEIVVVLTDAIPTALSTKVNPIHIQLS